MKKDVVTIKGVSEGIYIDIIGNDFVEIKKSLKTKLVNSSDFFKGGKFLGVRGDEISPETKLETLLVLKYKYELDIELPKETAAVKLEDEFVYEEENKFKEIVDEGITKFVYGTLRSGQEVSFNGNIVVIGDVNPGALLRAKGNIVVLGSLRGLAQAGIGGNSHAVVAAYSLLPTQLRIAEIIVRPPDDDTQYKLPEIAKVIDGRVVIEPYLPNR
jgi:septum site-determining protein MinC